MNTKIGVIANKVQNDRQFSKIKDIVTQYYPQYPLFEVKHSRCFDRIFSEKCSIKEMYQNNSIWSRPFSIVVEQFDNIIKFIEG